GLIKGHHLAQVFGRYHLPTIPLSTIYFAILTGRVSSFSLLCLKKTNPYSDWHEPKNKINRN
ncbi:MAG: hypothetical protein K2N63_06725, partial [Lachnospiraceae bacterium]|nr:hypothetical protein [Lachnospiraceae bacterium]